MQVYAATEKAEKYYTEVDMKVPLAVVMGAEDKGIDEGILNIVTEQVKIPMSGKIESLNVSAAAAVMIYEVVRQRRG